MRKRYIDQPRVCCTAASPTLAGDAITFLLMPSRMPPTATPCCVFYPRFANGGANLGCNPITVYAYTPKGKTDRARTAAKNFNIMLCRPDLVSAVDLFYRRRL